MNPRSKPCLLRGRRRPTLLRTTLGAFKNKLPPFETAAGNRAGPGRQDKGTQAIKAAPKLAALKSKHPNASIAAPSWARWAYWIAVPAAIIWAGCMIAFASGYQNPFGPFEYRAYPMVAFAGLCLLPAVFILLSAYAVRQAAKLSVETRRARELAGDLAIPAALAADQAAGAADSVRREVERAGAAAAAAEQQLMELRRALSEESDRLVEATSDAERRAQDLTGRPRQGARGNDQSQRASWWAGAIGQRRHHRAITPRYGGVRSRRDSDPRADATLAARAADLTTAATEAGEAAVAAGQLLSDYAERLEIAGETVSARVGGVQNSLSDEQNRLSALADTLRNDQMHIVQQFEDQRAQLVAASAEARASADELTEASVRGAESLRDLIASVAEQVGQLAATAEADQAALTETARLNLQLFTGVVAEERAALEAETRTAIEALTMAAAETRRQAQEQTEASRQQVEQLGEAAFAVAQKADQAFDSRITAARRMIEQSAGLVRKLANGPPSGLKRVLPPPRAPSTIWKNFSAPSTARSLGFPKKHAHGRKPFAKP